MADAAAVKQQSGWRAFLRLAIGLVVLLSLMAPPRPAVAACCCGGPCCEGCIFVDVAAQAAGSAVQAGFVRWAKNMALFMSWLRNAFGGVMQSQNMAMTGYSSINDGKNTYNYQSNREVQASKLAVTFAPPLTDTDCTVKTLSRARVYSGDVSEAVKSGVTGLLLGYVMGNPKTDKANGPLAADIALLSHQMERYTECHRNVPGAKCPLDGQDVDLTSLKRTRPWYNDMQELGVASAYIFNLANPKQFDNVQGILANTPSGAGAFLRERTLASRLAASWIPSVKMMGDRYLIEELGGPYSDKGRQTLAEAGYKDLPPFLPAAAQDLAVKAFYYNRHWQDETLPSLMNRNLLIEQVRQKMEELRSNYKMYENMQTYAVMRGLRLTHEAQAGYPDAPLAATPTVAPGTGGG